MADSFRLERQKKSNKKTTNASNCANNSLVGRRRGCGRRGRCRRGCRVRPPRPHQDDVLRLQVEVEDALGVAKVHALKDLSETKQETHSFHMLKKYLNFPDEAK